jgi:N6-adenosine-specific RNA methylase IME4
MNHILLESPQHNLTIIDIPASISSPPNFSICSSAAPEVPYCLPTPKAPSTTAPNESHIRIGPYIASALSAASQLYPSPRRYIYPRHISPSLPASTELNFNDTNISLLSNNNDSYPLGSIVLNSTSTVLSDISDIYSILVVNPFPQWVTLTLQNPAPPKHYYLPPRSSFLISSISPTSCASMLMGVLPLIGGKKFNIVVLDPPWPNRSATRKRCGRGRDLTGGGYKTSSRLDIIPLLASLPLRECVAPNGLVAIWTTNKDKFQRAVREELFPAWGCEVEAEWVWVKVTTSGEPMFELDHPMRKPYEILIFGRRRRKETNIKKKRKLETGMEEITLESNDKIQRIPPRVILAVPDLHSRKPCLKGWGFFFSLFIPFVL